MNVEIESGETASFVSLVQRHKNTKAFPIFGQNALLYSKLVVRSLCKPP